MNFFGPFICNKINRVQAGNENRPINWLVLFALVGVTAAVFSPVMTFEATNYDDANYVFENPAVLHGLTGESMKWAFTTGHAANWHPLTWLSHMTDVEIFGQNAGAHHAMNLLLHCANMGILFALLHKLTGALWRSAFVAALFGLHPLHVESVAWIAERKDVLSAFFGLMTLLAYVKYVSDVRPHATRWYATALVLFALGLMSKPMLVTLPFVMLLLDIWPLQQVRGTNIELATLPVGKDFRNLLLEKIPFLLLAGMSGAVTLIVQSHGGAVRTLQSFSFGERVANAVTSSVLHVAKSFWPAKLAAFYPMPAGHNAWGVAGAAALLGGISVWAIWSARRAPYRAVGWFWFLIMLAPVIGIVQVGMQQMADRYTYLPLIGVFVLIVWEAARIAERIPVMKYIFVAVAFSVIVACAVSARQQVMVWHNSETLFRHALAVTEGNYLAHNNLGYHLFTQGKTAEAIAEYEAALAINPGYTDAHNNLGRALAAQERHAEAVEHFEAVLLILPNDVIAHNNLGNVLALLGRHEEAIKHFRAAITVKRDHAAAHNNWALSSEELDRPAEAIEHYRAALQIDPNFTAALNNLAWILATHPRAKFRNGTEAMQLAEHACRLTGYDQPLPLLTLAAANAEAGQWPEAVSLATRAAEVASKRGDTSVLQNCEIILTKFNARQPYRHVSANP